MNFEAVANQNLGINGMFGGYFSVNEENEMLSSLSDMISFYQFLIYKKEHFVFTQRRVPIS